jgi:F-type H+-transporting ATPase subunit beta
MLRSSLPARPENIFPLSETIRGFREILEGKHDENPRIAVFLCRGIDEVVERYAQNGKDV